MFRPLTLSAALLAAPAAAQNAASTGTVPTCAAHWTALDPAELRPARVTSRRPVLTDVGGAPHPQNVAPDDLVLQGPSVGGRRCTYVPGDASRTGLLKDSETQALPTAALAGGTWERDPNAGLTLKAVAGALTLTGTAMFPTAGGSVNVGHLNGPLRRADAPRRWLYTDGDCAVTLWPLGPWLIAQDNARCGGLNVSFSGLYRRVR